MPRVTAEEAARTRERLLDAALEVFHEQGVATPSLTRVAERVGMTRGAIYGHFQNKSDLFASLCDRYLMSDTALEAYRNEVADDPLRGLVDWLERVVGHARDVRERRMLLEILFLRSEANPGDGIRARLEADGERGVHHQRELICMAVRAGQLAPDLDVDTAAWATNALLVGMLRSMRLHQQVGEGRLPTLLGPLVLQLLQGPALHTPGPEGDQRVTTASE